MSNYYVYPNIQTGMIEIRGGSKNGTLLFQVPLDETKEIIGQMDSARSMYKLVQDNMVPMLVEIRDVQESIIKLISMGTAIAEGQAIRDLEQLNIKINKLLAINQPTESSLARGPIATTASNPNATGEA